MDLVFCSEPNAQRDWSWYDGRTLQWTSKEPANSETGEDNSSILSYLDRKFWPPSCFPLSRGNNERCIYHCQTGEYGWCLQIDWRQLLYISDERRFQSWEWTNLHLYGLLWTRNTKLVWWIYWRWGNSPAMVDNLEKLCQHWKCNWGASHMHYGRFRILQWSLCH